MGGGPRAILKGEQANAITGTGGETERGREREEGVVRDGEQKGDRVREIKKEE